MKRSLFIFAFGALCFASCKKDDTAATTPTTTSLAGNYKVTAASAKYGSTAEVDVFGQIPACNKDDILTLEANGNYTLTDAGTKCSPPSDDSGTWSLPNSTTFRQDGTDYKIESFNGTNLRLSKTDNSSGTVIVVYSTLTKQ